MHVLRPTIAAAAALFAGQAAAVNITPTNDAFALANTLFLNLPGLQITGASISSAAADIADFEFGQQAALFQNPQGTYGLPAAGIALSSGNVSDYGAGPNQIEDATTSFEDPLFGGGNEANPEQESLLQPVTGVDQHFDVVQLDIEFFASFGDAPVSPGFETPVVNFFAAFGSEEWPEYTNGGVTDGFGLYVNGRNVAFAQQSGGGGLLPINIDHPDMRAAPGTELDGVLAPNGNPVLRFEVPINVGQLNTFTIILADAGDSVVDSTVYLSSFFADPGGIPGGPTIPGGQTEFDPIVPSNPPDPETGAFEIAIPDIPAGETIWIDPPVSVGYVYETVNGAGFEAVTAPSLATVADLDGYFITVGVDTVALAAGAMLDFFDVFGVNPTKFTLSGIDPSLMLDPTDPLAFPAGLSFVTATFSETVNVTPIVEDVDMAPIPLPGAGLLYLGALAAFGVGARRMSRRA